MRQTVAGKERELREAFFGTDGYRRDKGIKDKQLRSSCSELEFLVKFVSKRVVSREATGSRRLCEFGSKLFKMLLGDYGNLSASFLGGIVLGPRPCQNSNVVRELISYE